MTENSSYLKIFGQRLEQELLRRSTDRGLLAGKLLATPDIDN